MRALPVETEDYIAKKYEGYSGVIKCWICADFSCAGSFNSWLNSCAAPFERTHDGVYIEIETVSASAMEARDQAIAPPDMIFYSPSMKNTEHLTGACVLALGGTIGVTRDGAQFDPAQCAIGRDSNRDMAAAAILAGAGDSKSAPVEEIGVDLGLPAGTGAAMTAEQALQTFIDGSASGAMVTSAQLAKLIDRRDRGLSPNWECVRADTPFTDQLLLGAADCGGVLASYMMSDGARGDVLSYRAFENKSPFAVPREDTLSEHLFMNGHEVYKFAVRAMRQGMEAILNEAGILASDLAYMIPHQANIRIIASMVDKFGIPMEKVYINLEQYGNMSSACIPVALDELNRAGKLSRGDKLALVGFGGGLTCGAALLEW